MSEETKKTLRDVYRNIGSSLSLTPEDFGLVWDKKTASYISQENEPIRKEGK